MIRWTKMGIFFKSGLHRNVDVCKLCEVSVATTIEFLLGKLQNN